MISMCHFVIARLLLTREHNTMADRLNDLKKTVPFHKMGDMNSYGFGGWGLYDLLEAVKNDIELETYKGDLIDPCKDIPYHFTPGPNRSFFWKYTPYLENVKQNPYPSYEEKVVSAYKPFIDNIFGNAIVTRQFNMVILMMADGTFAGAVYKEGEIVASKEIVSVKSAKTSKSVKEDFRQKVKDLLQKWENQINSSDLVFVRCTYDDKLHFFEGKGETQDSRFRHIPFVTGKPTLSEIERVYDRLTRCIVHDSIENTLKEFRCEKKHVAVSTVTEVANEDNKRRMEKKMWPWMDSSLAKRLVDYVEDDNGNGLYDEVQAHPKKSQISEYLNSGNEKFNGGTFLHFAVQKEAVFVVEILLEIGCDPTVSDSQNKVPMEYCKSKDIQEVFIEYRNQNHDLFNWNKAKVPENANLPLHNERKKEVEVINKNDVSRRKRSDKLKNKKIRNYEY